MATASMALLRKAAEPGVRRHEFMDATRMASHTHLPEVHLAALESANRSIRLAAWRNPNLSNLGRPAIEALLEKIPEDDHVIRESGKRALSHC